MGWSDSVCSLCACLRLAWRLSTTWLSPCFSFCPPLSRSIPLPLVRSLVLCSLHFYHLQEYFTMWYLQCPPINLGQRWLPLEVLALCSVSPPLPRLKPNSTVRPQPCPLDKPLCHLLFIPQLSTAAHRQSCTLPLHLHSLCLPLLPSTLSRPLQRPHYLILRPLLAQSACPTLPFTSRGRNTLTPCPPLCVLSLLLRPLCPHPLCPLHRVLLPCTTHLDSHTRNLLAALQAAEAYGGLKVRTVVTPPRTCLPPGLDRFWGWGGGCHRAVSG